MSLRQKYRMAVPLLLHCHHSSCSRRSLSTSAIAGTKVLVRRRIRQVDSSALAQGLAATISSTNMRVYTSGLCGLAFANDPTSSATCSLTYLRLICLDL